MKSPRSNRCEDGATGKDSVNRRGADNITSTMRACRSAGHSFARTNLLSIRKLQVQSSSRLSFQGSLFNRFRSPYYARWPDRGCAAPRDTSHERMHVDIYFADTTRTSPFTASQWSSPVASDSGNGVSPPISPFKTLDHRRC